MNKKEKLEHYAFTTMPGLGRKAKQRLLTHFTEREILCFKERELQPYLTAKEWNYYVGHRRIYNIEETEIALENLKKKKIDFVYHRDKEYPKRLKNMIDYPLALFKKGSLPGDEKTFAIVGSRLPTPYGKEMAGYFARELTKAGISIISGLAFGVDVAAHRGALDAGGCTYGVLGCGPDIVYPKENYSIYEKMLSQGGIISEYRPGTKPEQFRFPERNRIISGLADGVLVVEAKAKSGSLITADQALEQGKEVFALPGRAGDPCSEGCNWLIREGARMVTEPSHILEELFHLCENSENNHSFIDNLLDNREKMVYDCLSLDPKSIEEIINETNFTTTEVISILFRLVQKEYICQIEGNYYIKKL